VAGLTCFSDRRRRAARADEIDGGSVPLDLTAHPKERAAAHLTKAARGAGG
jgi:hypothetical protein